MNSKENRHKFKVVLREYICNQIYNIACNSL